ncbi:Trypsin-1 [Orchesella cincta]|uniref:Trypsin-1 n=1 Tax=Orchesella cincta TaxID=48709 RepID=A0A1D2N300_ORCCI|nr:Trypsin-1 [Orchesella cincta]
MTPVTFFFILQIAGSLQHNENKLADKEPKITNGSPAKLGEIPYQIALYFQGKFICGGSFVIINGNHWVITAAHCFVYGQDPEDYIVVAGLVDVDDFTLPIPGQSRTVTKIAVHEDFNDYSDSATNDIAILAIDYPFEINPNVSPIRLPKKRERIGNYGVVSGWGKVSESGLSSQILRKTKVLVGPNKSCERSFPELFVAKTMICAGVHRGECKGDSGGPLVDLKKKFLAGIVSFGEFDCTKPKHNGFYTRVSAFVNWIQKTATEIEEGIKNA